MNLVEDGGFEQLVTETIVPEEEKPRIPARQIIDGHPFPPKLAFSENNIRSGLKYQPADDDTFIVTFPKCGTTWMQYIVWDIVHRAAVTPPNMNNMMSKFMPFLELVGSEVVQETESPRFIKTHLPFHLQPYNANSKYIYVARNPRDCCVSFYHFVHDIALYCFLDGTFEESFECFLTGNTPFGDFFDHILSWYEHRNDPNVLFLTYEEMQADNEGSILAVAQFLGDEYYNPVVADEDLLHRIQQRTSYDSMSSQYSFYRPVSQRAAEMVLLLNGRFPDAMESPVKGFQKVNFFRKGVVGNWKEYMTAEQELRLDEIMLDKMGDTELCRQWLSLYSTD